VCEQDQPIVQKNQAGVNVTMQESSQSAAQIASQGRFRPSSHRWRAALGGLAALLLASCGDGGESAVAIVPTDTLAPLVTLTPRVTATPVRTQTPLPTFTFTPSVTPVPPTPTISPTPSEVPPIIGIIASLQTVNVREGPGVSFSAFVALDPGTGVIVLGRTEDGRWYNVRLDDGREGWVAADLVRVQPTATPFVVAQLQATVDLTALALGTPLPTAVLGGGTVTPTPPVVSGGITPTPPATPGTPTPQISNTPVVPVIAPTTAGGTTAPPTLPSSTLSVGTPAINTTSIAQTVTALAAGAASPTPSGTAPGESGGPDAPGPTPLPGTPGVGRGVDVLAYCDNPIFGSPAPGNLAAGSTIDVFWSWFARTPEQVQDHLRNASYDVRLDGVPLRNWANFRTSVRQERDGNYHVYWYVPSEPLAAGEHTITYRVTWAAAITDGYADFGPGTARPFEEGTCTFTVR
jgi:SH3-like domain-containing protein